MSGTEIPPGATYPRIRDEAGCPAGWWVTRLTGMMADHAVLDCFRCPHLLV